MREHDVCEEEDHRGGEEITLREGEQGRMKTPRARQQQQRKDAFV